MRNAIKLGEQVYLRRIETGDAVALARASHLESETAMHRVGRVPMSVLSFEWWIQQLGLDDEQTEIVFAICRLSDDVFIGTASLRAIDQINGTAETGMGLLSKQDRGRGIGTEAKHLLLSYAFEDLDLHAVSATIFEGNTRSTRAVEKQGYHLAGRLTATQHIRGEFCNTLVYAISSSDWKRNRAS